MPCGTLYILPSNTTFIVLPVRNLFSHSSINCATNSIMGIFLRSFEWGTVSNASLKSNTAMSVWVPVSKEKKRSCTKWLEVVFHMRSLL